MTDISRQVLLEKNSKNYSDKEYDYIITGAGCAGLSLVMHIIASGKLNGKKILLVDRDAKTSNDRTWCFWEKEEGLFQSIVYKEWKQLEFKSAAFHTALEIEPYTYKLIRGIDFYQYCFEQIQNHSNICFMQGDVERIISNENETYITVNGKKIKGDQIFNSIIFKKPALTARHLWLLQHFAGWFIETDNDVFNPESAMLMDFDTDQNKGTAFFYVLPFSKTKALVEYTLFSPDLLKPVEYEAALRNYIAETLQISSYTVYDKESGSIPMTNYRFQEGENNIINIGTAGGQTKASSGYTFRFIQKHSARMAASLAKAGDPLPATDTKRFAFYDSVLLRILTERKLEGRQIFKRLFEKNSAAKVLKFLDNETSLAEELSIISSLPTMPFLKAAIKQTGISG